MSVSSVHCSCVHKKKRQSLHNRCFTHKLSFLLRNFFSPNAYATVVVYNWKISDLASFMHTEKKLFMCRHITHQRACQQININIYKIEENCISIITCLVVIFIMSHTTMFIHINSTIHPSICLYFSLSVCVRWFFSLVFILLLSMSLDYYFECDRACE